MHTADAIDKAFTNGFNEAAELYDADRLVECEKMARELLAKPYIPRYHSMKTQILLGSIVGDWYEACDFRIAAETMWRIVS
jgi:hypothetical protein